MDNPLFTTVVGVDEKHLEQLRYTWPTWIRHKPMLLDFPLLVFYDQTQINQNDVHRVVRRHKQLRIVPWPEPGIVYEGDDSKWHDPQRYKMLAGFVHIPGCCVDTPYWLKIDTDVVATGCPDWVDRFWFKGHPGIISHRWGMTKPPNQIDLLDQWVADNRRSLEVINQMPALNLHPLTGAVRLQHSRVISWCGFFSTALTRFAAMLAAQTVGPYKLPVPSQDGYLWYVATRMQNEVRRVNMKDCGWEWWSTMSNVRKASERAMA